ncbi:MAG: polysaccharide biosynthesis tyrosine autokinase [Bryobacteraceae bacterium]
MRLLSSGPDDPMNGLVHDERPVFPTIARQPYVLPNGNEEPEPPQSFDVLALARRYWLLLLSFLILGSAVGFASVVLSSPMYKTLLLMEVQNTTSALTPNGQPQASAETNELDIQTQVNILHSGSFLRRGAERMQSETVPLAPIGRDLFSRLRQRIHPVTQDPLEAARTGLLVAVKTFEARPVLRTRLIELSCESTSPEVASEFLNAMAQEFLEDTSHSRIQTAQKTSEWLAAQIEETKSRVQEAEEKLRDFVQASGNVFAGQDATLDDTKLAQLKGELAKIQNERIARQTRYELTVHNPPESLAEVLDDGILRGYKAQLETLKRDRAVLSITYTPKHEKIQKIDAQIAEVQRSYDNELNSTVRRIKNDYDASLRQEKLLTGAYDSQSQRVGSEASKTAQYNSLKREVDTQHQMYQTLLVQQSEANLSSSVPINPIRIVEASTAPEEPYKPKPVLNISLGTLFGIVLAGGIVFLRERMDRSIKNPGVSRRLFNAPELGVIPNLGSNGNMVPKMNGHGAKDMLLNGAHDDSTALATWQSGPAFITESFRGTLASILRNQASNKNQKMILITSPGPAEGKTTVVQNLGIALAESGRKVLLVDADFRRPHLHRKFSLPNEWGLIDVLCDDRPLSDYSPEQMGVFTGFPGLSILPNRVTHHNISKALYSPRLRTILETLVHRYDMVIVDAPPILSVADTRIVASLTDALILVLRSGVTQRDAAMETYQLIQEDGLTLLGTVLTDYDLTSDRRRQYYYDYGDPTRA